MLDISLKLDASLPIYPGDPKLELTRVAEVATHGFCLSHVAFGTHTGTHVDAPAHFIEGGTPFSELPLERFVGPCWVLDVPNLAVETVRATWPTAEPVERALFKTPNSGKPFPAAHVFDAEAARWLLTTGVKLVGIDSLSIERDVDGSFPVHHLLLGADVLLLEGLDLSGVPAGPYELLCLPLKLDVPDGGPVRAALRPR